jgi:hypothetical protein
MNMKYNNNKTIIIIKIEIYYLLKFIFIYILFFNINYDKL